MVNDLIIRIGIPLILAILGWILLEIIKIKILLSVHDKQLGVLESRIKSEQGTVQRVEDRLSDRCSSLESRIYAIESRQAS